MVFLSTVHTSSFSSSSIPLLLGDVVSPLVTPLPSFFHWQGYLAIQRPLLASIFLLSLWFLVAVMSGCHVHLNQLLSPFGRLVAQALIVGNGLAEVSWAAAQNNTNKLWVVYTRKVVQELDVGEVGLNGSCQS